MYISHQHKLLFMPLPKSGCTTVKRLLWYMDSGFQVDLESDIHVAYRTEEYNKVRRFLSNETLTNYYTFCIVRDPVDRLISAYNHRVLELGEIRNSEKVKNNDCLPTDPNFFQFVNNLEDYKTTIPVIKHHVLPMCKILGGDPTFYDRIYKLTEINTDLIPFLESKCGHNLAIDMSVNKSPHVVKRKNLSHNLIEKIKTIYKKDYDLYGQYM